MIKSIFFINLFSFFLFIYFSCSPPSPNYKNLSQEQILEEAKHEEIEKLWLEYFDELNQNNFQKALTYMKPSVIFNFGKTIEIDGYEKLEFQLKNWKNKLKKNELYIKVHKINSAKVENDFMTIIDVVQGEYSIARDELIREKRTFYYFHLSKRLGGYKIFMITDAALEN